MQSTLGWHPKEIKILVVDDEPTARLVARKILEKTGYTGTAACRARLSFTTFLNGMHPLFLPHADVEVVESGRKATELISTQSFHLILCDLHMPDIDGERIDPTASSCPGSHLTQACAAVQVSE